VRPEHVVGAVALAASVLLVASQFSDYRGVGVGSPAYAGLENVVTAPETAKQTPIDAHWYLLLVAAAASLALLYMVLVRRRWLLGRAISAIGLAAIAISLAVDIPQGLDTGQTSKIFAGAKAVLLGGFWVELFASALLVLSGMLLASYGRGAAAPARQRRRPAQRRTPRTTPDRSSRLAEGST
jgi:hypothetical protein